MNQVLPREGRWLTGDASTRDSKETGVQVDPVQTCLDELLRRLAGQESLIRTFQATQIPLNEEQPETDSWTTEATEPQRRPDDDAWWNGNDQWTGHRLEPKLEQLAECILSASPSQRTIPRLCRCGMETQTFLMTLSLMSSCIKERIIQAIIVLLFLG